MGLALHQSAKEVAAPPADPPPRRMKLKTSPFASHAADWWQSELGGIAG